MSTDEKLSKHITDFARILNERANATGDSKKFNIDIKRLENLVAELYNILDQAKLELEEIKRARNEFLYAMIKDDLVDVKLDDLKTSNELDEKLKAMMDKINSALP